jgi:hypothetical protein
VSDVDLFLLVRLCPICRETQYVSHFIEAIFSNRIIRLININLSSLLRQFGELLYRSNCEFLHIEVSSGFDSYHTSGLSAQAEHYGTLLSFFFSGTKSAQGCRKAQSIFTALSQRASKSELQTWQQEVQQEVKLCGEVRCISFICETSS